MKEITSEILEKKYFIFDIDGTLIDSMGMWNLVDQQVIFNQLGVMVDIDEIKAFRDSVIYNNQNVHGDIYMTYYAELIKYLGLDMTPEQYREELTKMSNHLSVNELDYKPGADEFLKAIKQMGKKVGVATTTIRSQYDIYENKNQKLIKKAPLKNLVDVKVLCEDVTRKKPDPEVYLKVLADFGCDAKDCIVFEDSLNGIISAKEAGIDVVAVYDDSAKNEQELIDKITDYKVESFEVLMRILGLDKSQNQPQ